MAYSFLSGYSTYSPFSSNLIPFDSLLIFKLTISVSKKYALKFFLILRGSDAFSRDLCLILFLSDSRNFLTSSVQTYYSYVIYVPISWNVIMTQLWPLLAGSANNLLLPILVFYTDMCFSATLIILDLKLTIAPFDILESSLISAKT